MGIAHHLGRGGSRRWAMPTLQNNDRQAEVGVGPTHSGILRNGSVRAGQTSGRVEGGVMRPAPSAALALARREGEALSRDTKFRAK